MANAPGSHMPPAGASRFLGLRLAASALRLDALGSARYVANRLRLGPSVDKIPAPPHNGARDGEEVLAASENTAQAPA